MSEENEEKVGFFQQLKNQIMAGVGILLTGIGTMFMDEVKSFVGIEDEEKSEVHAPVQNQSVNVSGPEIIINIPEQKTQPSVVREVVREVPVQSEVDTVVVEPPSARDRLLNRRKN
jgi:hypothetical protein